MEASADPAVVGTEFHSTGDDPMGSFTDRSVVTEATSPSVFEFVTEGHLEPKKQGEAGLRHAYHVSVRDRAGRHRQCSDVPRAHLEVDERAGVVSLGRASSDRPSGNEELCHEDASQPGDIRDRSLRRRKRWEQERSSTRTALRRQRACRDSRAGTHARTGTSSGSSPSIRPGTSRPCTAGCPTICARATTGGTSSKAG